ncbi:MAG: mtrA [Nocardia sp.]|uniref:response regulator transcription factor n=1 Tax=Nocardia sp. TaxID=1821 RepID=UPI0026364FDD|nr:response regulator [Nocardia sp.]MCU1646792.1 mtrA [Nocardia sp.]
MNQYPPAVSRTALPPVPLGRRNSELIKVLIVENDPAVAEMAAIVLAKAGYDPVRAATGGQALITTDTWHPDLVLVDLALPDLRGSEICLQLRQHTVVPIVVLADETDPDFIELVMAAGASDYLLKPFRTGELLTRIHTRLTGSTDIV